MRPGAQEGAARALARAALLGWGLGGGEETEAGPGQRDAAAGEGGHCTLRPQPDLVLPLGISLDALSALPSPQSLRPGSLLRLPGPKLGELGAGPCGSRPSRRSRALPAPGELKPSSTASSLLFSGLSPVLPFTFPFPSRSSCALFLLLLSPPPPFPFKPPLLVKRMHAHCGEAEKSEKKIKSPQGNLRVPALSNLPFPCTQLVKRAGPAFYRLALNVTPPHPSFQAPPISMSIHIE